MHTWVWKPTKLIMNRLPGGNDAHLSMKANKIDYESFTWWQWCTLEYESQQNWLWIVYLVVMMHTWVWKPTKLIMNRLPGGNDAHLSMKANKIDYESFTWW